jgi:hypothetical protein
MVKTSIDAPGELQRAAELLFKNWMLAVPTAAASLIVGILSVFVFASIIATALVGGAVAGRTGAGLVGLLAGLPMMAVFGIIAALLVIVAQAVVIHASEDVWEGRPVELGHSVSVALGRLVPLIGVFVLVALIMIIPIALCFVIIGIPIILIVAFFLMYAIPAVVLGGDSPTAAIGTSYRIARENIGPSVIAFIGIAVAAIIGSILNALLRHGAVLTLIGSLVVGGYTSAYCALVAARFYTLLRPQTSLAPPTV